MSSNLVSVVLPAFNAESYLHSAIESILNQSYAHFELIIINDGSTDSTHDIITNFKDERIHYYQNPQNLGLINSLNIGFEKASGQFIARMDADDIAHPDRLKTQVNFLMNLKTPAIVGSNMVLINSKNEIIKVPRRMNFSPEENSWVKLRKCPVHHPTVMISKEIIQACKPFYSLNDTHAEDYGAWLRTSEQFPIYNLKDYLLFYRVHETNLSAIHHPEQLRKSIELINTSIGKLGLHPITATTLHQMLLLKVKESNLFDATFNEMEKFGKTYINKYGKKAIVLQDTAYAILSIGLKSCRFVLVKSLFSLSLRLGFMNMGRAFVRIGQEFVNSVVLKLYFQTTFKDMLNKKKITKKTTNTNVNSLPLAS